MIINAKRKYVLIFSLALLFPGCDKKTQVNGVVYSAHNIPVPGVYVGWNEYHESNYAARQDYQATKTNEKGEFQFSFSGRKKYKFTVSCQCDSGFREVNVTVGTTNTEDLHLIP